MKKTTKWLTDKPREYFEPELTLLANKRIECGLKLMCKLAKRRYNGELEEDDVQRYMDAEDMVNWWRGLLDEA